MSEVPTQASLKIRGTRMYVHSIQEKIQQHGSQKLCMMCAEAVCKHWSSPHNFWCFSQLPVPSAEPQTSSKNRCQALKMTACRDWSVPTAKLTELQLRGTQKLCNPCTLSYSGLYAYMVIAIQQSITAAPSLHVIGCSKACGVTRLGVSGV